jgi:hypothetical protein
VIRTRATSIVSPPPTTRSGVAVASLHQRDGETVSQHERLGAAISAAAGEQLKGAGAGPGGGWRVGAGIAEAIPAGARSFRYVSGRHFPD